MVSFGVDNSEQSAKVFSAKILFFVNLRKFPPLKISHYTVIVLSVSLSQAITDGH